MLQVLDSEFFLRDKRTHGSSAVEVRRKLESWNDHWTTLTVNSDGNRISCQKDTWTTEPHGVPKETLLENYPQYDLSTLAVSR